MFSSNLRRLGVKNEIINDSYANESEIGRQLQSDLKSDNEIGIQVIDNFDNFFEIDQIFFESNCAF